MDHERHWGQKERPDPGPSLRVLISGILVVAAPATRLLGFALGLGALLSAAGLPIPLLGEGRVNQTAEWWLRQSKRTLRSWRRWP